MNIAFAGPSGSGKTTAANILSERGYYKISLAGPVRKVTQLLYGSDVYTKPTPPDVRKQLQDVGSALRAMDEDIWVKTLLRHVDPGGRYVVDDVRYPNEVRLLREAGFLVVRIQRDSADAVVRRSIRGRWQWWRRRRAAHPSETEALRLACDYLLPNNGTIADLERNMSVYVLGG